MRGQLAVDQATVQANRIARGFSEITAPIGGRTGSVSVYQGSLVQPNDILVNITQIDPINVSFTLPEREFVSLQEAAGQWRCSCPRGTGSGHTRNESWTPDIHG